MTVSLDTEGTSGILVLGVGVLFDDTVLGYNQAASSTSSYLLYGGKGPFLIASDDCGGLYSPTPGSGCGLAGGTTDNVLLLFTTGTASGTSSSSGLSPHGGDLPGGPLATLVFDVLANGDGAGDVGISAFPNDTLVLLEGNVIEPPTLSGAGAILTFGQAYLMPQSEDRFLHYGSRQCDANPPFDCFEDISNSYLPPTPFADLEAADGQSSHYSYLGTTSMSGRGFGEAYFFIGAGVSISRTGNSKFDVTFQVSESTLYQLDLNEAPFPLIVRDAFLSANGTVIAGNSFIASSFTGVLQPGIDYRLLAEGGSEIGWNFDFNLIASVCGDGLISGSEICDDANALALDGCSDTCSVEPEWICVGEPSVCTTVAAAPGLQFGGVALLMALMALLGPMLLMRSASPR